jgi:1,4-dihydroxy-2-naphthoyl-CoA hydrolase
MALWKKHPSLEQLNNTSQQTMAEHLGIVFTDIGEDYLEATMPVSPATQQPYGLLHGGASVALAETLGSVASNLCLPEGEKKWCVGLEINANHLRSVKSGLVTGRATALHIGKTTHVWDIRIRDERNQPTVASRLTVAVIAARD